MENILIEKVIVDPGIQLRDNQDGNVVAEYAEQMLQEADFPAATVFFDGKNYILADGFHRIAAKIEAGQQSIKCYVHQGGRRDALLFAAGANAQHGIRRTNADKRKAVMCLLLDKEWRQWSDNAIAKHCGVSQPLVRDCRQELILTYRNYKSNSIRVTSNGRAINTAKIGNAASSGSNPQQEKTQRQDIDRPTARYIKAQCKYIKARDIIRQKNEQIKSLKAINKQQKKDLRKQKKKNLDLEKFLKLTNWTFKLYHTSVTNIKSKKSRVKAMKKLHEQLKMHPA